MTGAERGPPSTCPNCGDPVALTVILAPGAAYARPCGCRVEPVGDPPRY